MPASLPDLFQRHLTRPFTQRINALRNKIADVNALLDKPALYDQYPGRAQPFAFTRLYGPLPLTTARRMPSALGGTGFELLAPLADSAAYVTPRNGNVKVGRYGSFVWTSTSIFSYVSLTYSADPGLPGNYETFPSTGDIFDPVLTNNGGALACNNLLYVNPETNVALPESRAINISFDLGLYDKLRGRFLHDTDRMPPHFFSGQNFSNRRLVEPIRFDDNTEIEPRLYVNEIRAGTLLDTDQAYNAAMFKAYVMLTFFGRLEQQEP
ncbi:MAG: hypothetical protein EBT03_07340 [Betaproteobacteria bacterium]|nr:hypothetical protein [Betaproteobacteria bacterium]NCA16483.1 hypothetical protein [Betaproteobacteria bacterium]